MQISHSASRTRITGWLRWAALHSLLAVLSTLIIVLPIPFRPTTARADAFQVTSDSESFNFPAQSAAMEEAMAEGASANALKQRTSPVSASGAFSTSVSIDLPPGRSGMTPSLGLSYTSDSNRKDSPVGAGWSFGVSSISRDTSEGFPPVSRASGRLLYDDERTLFVGPAGRLMRSTASEGMARVAGSILFVPQRERSPVRYEFVPADDRWIEHLPSGVKRWYGATGSMAGRVVNELGTAEWLLLKEQDADGNTIEYDYHHLNDPDGQSRIGSWQRAQAQPVLKSVRWGANARASISNHLFRVETVTRPYQGQLDMLNGHTLLKSQITAIKVYGPVVGGTQERLYWEYVLDLTQSTDTFRHLLRSVTRRGYSATTGALETTDTKRYSYSENGAASWLRAGDASATVNTATRAAYSADPRSGEPLPLPGAQAELYRSGFQIDVSYGPRGQRPTLDSEQIADLIKQRPMDALSPEYRGAGYRFEDFDADGDVDVLYHPTGLGTPAARWLQHKSYLRSSGGFSRMAPGRDQANGTINGIPGTLLATSFADVDGDTDPDAVAFPVWWTNPTVRSSPEAFTENYRSNQNPFDIEQIIRSLSEADRKWLLTRLLRPTNHPDEAAVCVPSDNPIVSEGGMLMNFKSAPPTRTLSLPLGVSPNRGPLPGWVGTTDPEENLRWGDPMLDIRYRIGRALGYCRYIPWHVKIRPLPAARDDLDLKLAYNTSRGTVPTPSRADNEAVPKDLETRIATLKGWPRSATKKAVWGMKPVLLNLSCGSAPPGSICSLGTDSPIEEVDLALRWLTSPERTATQPRIVWNASFNQVSDFQAPMADVNADGRADIVLLKSMGIFAGGTDTNFTPGVFLSKGNNTFISGRDNAAGIAFDVTTLFPTVNWQAIDLRRSYAGSIRKQLASLRPGPESQLAPAILDLLPSLQRAEAEGVLRAFRDVDPLDEAAAASLRTAVLSAFDRGIEFRYPAPLVSLQNLSLEIIRTLSGSWFGSLINFSASLFPAFNVDVTEVLIPMNDRVYVSFAGLYDVVRRAGRADVLTPFVSFARAILPVLGIDLETLLPGESPDADFTMSALDIFNGGSDTVCASNDESRSCDRIPTYPISINFNSFPFDANGDGLPDMVAAHPPLPVALESQMPRGCANGHRVHLNRGYRWDDVDEALRNATLDREGWSSPSVISQLNTGRVSRTDALSLLNQRDQACDEHPLIEIDNGGLFGSPSVGGATLPGLPFDSSIPAAFRGLPMSTASFADVNADGLTDVVFAAVVQADLGNPNDPKALNQHIFLNTPRGFRYIASNTGTAVLDANLRLSPNNPWRGLPSDFYASQYLRRRGSTLGTQDRARLVDVDNDGLLDVVYRGECLNIVSSQNTCSTAKWRRNLRKIPDLLTRVDEGSGAWSEIDYVSANSDEGRATVLRSRPGAAPPTGLMIVREIRSGAQPIATRWANAGGETAQRVKLTYDNYMREEGSKRALAFETVTAVFGQEPACTTPAPCATTCSVANGKTACTFVDIASSTTTYDVAQTVAGTSVSYPLRGSVRSIRSLDLTQTTSEQITTYDYLVSALGSAARIRSGRVIHKTREGTLWMYSASEPSSLDTYGYAQTVTSGRATDQGAVIVANPETVITQSTYAHRASEWRLGREGTVTTLGDRVDPLTGTRTRDQRYPISKTVTTYDTAGRVATHSVLQDVGGNDCSSGAQWNVTSFPAYNAANQPTQLVDNGSTITLTYDGSLLYPKRRSTVVPVSPSSLNGATLAEEATYDPRFGSVTSTVDANGNATARSYDSRGRLLTTVGPDDSLLESNRYSDVAGGPWTVATDTYTTETSFFTTWSALDGYGRTIATNKQVNGATAVRVSRNQYDGLGRLIASYQPAALDVQTSYTLQNLALGTGALATRTTYDGFDRVRTQTLPDGRVSRSAFDHVTVSNLVYARTTATNPRNLNTVYLYNTRGSLLSMERRNASNAAVMSYSYEYDGAGRMVAVQDSVGTRRIGFDEGGRLRLATLAYQAGQTPRAHEYCYDARAKLARATTPAGREVIISRDSLGRASSVTADFERVHASPPTTQPTTASFIYDCSAAEGSLGRLCERTDNAATTRITYDEYGRANRYETTLDEAIASTLPAGVVNMYSVSLTFGLAGQLQNTTVEGLGTSSRSVNYTHDLLARTNGMTVSDGQGTRQLVKAATYDGFQRLKNVTLGNDVVSAWDFDLATSRLSAQRMQRGTSTFAELRYPLANYDANGNIGREQRYAGGSLASEKIHTYDALDQLETSILKVGTVERKNERFTYSQGNISTVVGGGRTDTYRYGDARNKQAVSSVAGGTSPSTNYSRNLIYDADGWVSRDVETRPNTSGPATLTERSLTFDASGCMREAVVRQGPVNGAAQTTTTRNMCGLGAARAYRETTFPDAHVERVYYLPDGSELRPEQNLFVMQLPVATSTVATLAWSLSTGQINHSESGYIHSDVRGSVVARTALTKTGTAVTTPDSKTEYGAWGDTVAYSGVSVPRYQYTNEEPDPGTGYYYFGARPYDPTLRRWLAPDPLLMLSPESDAFAATQLNLYSYAANNPVTHVDPDGKLAFLPVLMSPPGQAALLAAGKALLFVGSAALAAAGIIHLSEEVNSDSSTTTGAPPPSAPNGGPSSGPSTEPPKPPVPDVGPAIVAKVVDDALKNRAPAPAAAAGGGGEGGGDNNGGDDDESGPKKGSEGGPGAGKRFSEPTRDAAERQADGKCVFCGEETTREPGPNQRNTDHAIPKSRNGNNTLDNAQNACRTCNLDKQAKTTEEYLEELRRRAATPTPAPAPPKPKQSTTP